MTGHRSDLHRAAPPRASATSALARAARARREPCRLPLRAGPLPVPRRSATACSRGPATPRTSASPCGSSIAAPGASPPGWSSPPTRRVRVAETAVAVAEVAADDDHHAGRARPRAGLRRRHLGLGLRHQPARGATRGEGGAARSTGPTRLRARRRRRPRHGRRSSRCRRTSTTPTSPAPAPPSSGCGCSPSFEAMGADDDRHLRLDGLASPRPVGRGWEYLTDGGYDWDAELDEVPELLAEKLAAPSVEAGSYDLVIHPSNLWLTIHESIGHATELDRALGYEANYAGTSFATYDKLGTLAVRLTGHERHRRPHRRARPVHRRLRRRGRRRPSAGTSSRTACSSATSSTARWGR